MFTPASPSTVKVLAATPGWLFIPAPTSETFPIRASVAISPMPSSATSGSSASRARVEVVARHGERHVGAAPVGSGSFWMIMSTFTFASASAVSTRPGDAGLVGQAGEGDAGLVGGVGDGCDEGAFHGLLLGQDEGTGSVLEARPAVDPHAVVARVLHRAQLEHARARGGHLEHLLERDDAELARVGHDARVGAEHARARRCRSRTRRRRAPRRAPPPSCPSRRGRASSRPWTVGDALEAGHEHDLALVERGADPVGAHVEDARLGVRGVGDDARPASR